MGKFQDLQVGAYIRVRQWVANIQDSRRANDRGAGFAEYGAALILVASVAGVVMTASDDIAKQIKQVMSDAVDQVSQSEDGGGTGKEPADDSFWPDDKLIEF